MTNRQTIRRELRRLGWKPDTFGDLRKGHAIAVLAPDSSLGIVGPIWQGRREASLWFPATTPDAVVVAACEAWAAAPATTGRPTDPTRSTP